MTARPSSGLQRRDYVELSLWLLTAAAARFAVVYLGDFDGYWGQDPWGYLDQALGLLSDSTHPHLPRIAATEAFWPQGYPAIIAAGIWLGLDLIVWGQLSALLAGALTAPALWLAAHHAELSRTTARVAAGLLALCPVHLLWSTCATSDVMATAWLTLALLCLASPRGGCWSSGWAGVALGAALCTRLAAAPAILGLALLVAARRQGDAVDRHRRLRHDGSPAVALERHPRANEPPLAAALATVERVAQRV